MATTRLITIDDVAEIEDDGYRYDLIEGELHRMPPASEGHGLRGARLFIRLGAHVLAHRLGEMLLSETGYILTRDPDTLLSPDGAFIRAERVPAGYGRTGFSEVIPDLAIEVLSPSDYTPLTRRKIAAYLDAGVAVIWIVDPRRRTVSVHRAGQEPLVIPETGELDGGDIVPGFRLKLSEIFA